jgi:DNA-binding transcriptional regulator of glucitol operon
VRESEVYVVGAIKKCLLCLVLAAGTAQGTTFKDTVKAITDDGFLCSGIIYATAGNGHFFGWFSGRAQIAAERYQNVTVPQGAVIDSAIWETRKRGGNSTDTVVFRVQCEDTADATTLSDSTDFKLRVLTTASITDTIIAGQQNTWYSIPITSPVQEVISRGDWSSGNDLLIKSTGLSTSKPSGDDVQFQAYSYNGDITL